ncbi:hypothetical protein NE237_028833 [Protea cynaroides]|uniref:Uncharacterized protein n=1 Tax=Protea cynaroides TaxID=273540 RepID=A0A9Q0GRY6_9MAGN|nr:hypothetical protein NE237_028833 [Protea cynaroides]
MGKSKLPKFDFDIVFQRPNHESKSKGKTIADVNTSKKQKITLGTSSNKVGIWGVKPQSPLNNPCIGLIAPKKLGHLEVLNTFSTIDLLNFAIERVKVWDAEHFDLLQKYESMAQDLRRERENTNIERKNVFEEREKTIREKERASKEKERADKIVEELKTLKEEKASVETKLKEVEDSIQVKVEDAIIGYRDSNELYSYICDFEQFKPLRHDLGSIASKQALHKLCDFVQERTPGDDFSGFIVDLDAPISPDSDREENTLPLMNDDAEGEADS